MSKKWKFIGIKNLEKEFTKKLTKINNYSEQGLLDAADYLLELSQPLVPVDTGRLKKSGKVVQENANTVYVTYEAFNPENGYDYAPIQHEVLDFKHTIGQAKYLEQPFLTNMDNLINVVAGNIKKGIDK